MAINTAGYDTAAQSRVDPSQKHPLWDLWNVGLWDLWNVGSFAAACASFERPLRHRSLHNFIEQRLRSTEPLPCVHVPGDLAALKWQLSISRHLTPDQWRFLVWYLANLVNLIRNTFEDKRAERVIIDLSTILSEIDDALSDRYSSSTRGELGYRLSPEEIKSLREDVTRQIQNLRLYLDYFWQIKKSVAETSKILSRLCYIARAEILEALEHVPELFDVEDVSLPEQHQGDASKTTLHTEGGGSFLPMIFREVLRQAWNKACDPQFIEHNSAEEVAGHTKFNQVLSNPVVFTTLIERWDLWSYSNEKRAESYLMRRKTHRKKDALKSRAAFDNDNNDDNDDEEEERDGDDDEDD